MVPLACILPDLLMTLELFLITYKSGNMGGDISGSKLYQTKHQKQWEKNNRLSRTSSPLSASLIWSISPYPNFFPEDSMVPLACILPDLLMTLELFLKLKKKKHTNDIL